MGRRKLEKFEAIGAMPNVYQCSNGRDVAIHDKEGNILEMKGNWNKHFKNNNPIVLELACGYGEYTLGLAKMYPDVNFIGIDIKGARIYQGAKIALAENISNAAFLRTRIEFIDTFFTENEIAKIWITFPDPFLKDSGINRRLTSPRFLERYKMILKDGGTINLKTDSPELYAYTHEVIKEDTSIKVHYDNDDIYASSSLYLQELEFKTRYEKKHLANKLTIKFLQFEL